MVDAAPAQTGKETPLPLLRIKPVPHAKPLEARTAAVGADNVVGPWVSAGLFTDSRAMALNGLGTGITYKIGVRAIGGSTCYSDWSDSIEHMRMQGRLRANMKIQE